MKKIIATVLAMVMALALCTTAFAAADKYDGYLANSTNLSGGKLTADAVVGCEDFTLTGYAAVKNSDGSGNLEYYVITISGVEHYYVKTTAPTVSDYAVTSANKTEILFYLHEVDREAEYEASAKAFTNFGASCGQFVNNDNSKYYEVTTGTNKGNVYKAADKGAGGTYVLVDDAIVTLVTTKTDVKAHTWVATSSKVVNSEVIPTAAACACGATTTKIYETGKAPAGSEVEPLTGSFAKTYVVVVDGTTTSTGSTTTTTSPKTFDAGIAMYVGMALTSVAGSAVVIGKKKEF